MSGLGFVMEFMVGPRFRKEYWVLVDGELMDFSQRWND